MNYRPERFVLTDKIINLCTLSNVQPVETEPTLRGQPVKSSLL
jgi:hypothetical protein